MNIKEKPSNVNAAVKTQVSKGAFSKIVGPKIATRMMYLGGAAAVVAIGDHIINKDENKNLGNLNDGMSKPIVTTMLASKKKIENIFHTKTYTL